MKKLTLLLLLLGAFFTPVYLLAQPSGGGSYQLTFTKLVAVINGTPSASTYLDGSGNWTTPAGGGGNATTISLSNITAGTLATTLALGTQNITSTGNSSVTVGNLLFQDASEALGFTNSTRAVRMPGGLLCSNTAVTTGYIAINGGNGTALTGGATLQVQGATATINPGYAILGCGGVSGALVQLKDKNGTTQLTVSETGINGTGRATLGNLTLSGQASTGIAHVDSGGNFTSSALVNGDMPTAALNPSLSNITSGTLATTLALGTQGITQTGNNTWALPTGTCMNITVNGVPLLEIGQSAGVQGDLRCGFGAYSLSADATKTGFTTSGTNFNFNAPNLLTFKVNGATTVAVDANGLNLTVSSVVTTGGSGTWTPAALSVGGVGQPASGTQACWVPVTIDGLRTYVPGYR